MEETTIVVHLDDGKTMLRRSDDSQIHCFAALEAVSVLKLPCL